VLYILAALLMVLMVLVVLLLLRQGQANQAQLDSGETDKIVAALSSNLTRVQGEIQKTGIEQLVAQNKTVLDGETARGEEQLKARQGEIDKGLSEVRQELGKLRELVREVDSKRGDSIVKLETVTREAKQQTELLRTETGRLNEVLQGVSRGASGVSVWLRTCSVSRDSSRAFNIASSSKCRAVLRGRTSRSLFKVSC
jgi:hypothetical protein